MGQPTWREIVKVMVPERPTSLWTPALDYVTPGKLYQIVVEALAVAQDAPPVRQEATPPEKDVVPAKPEASSVEADAAATEPPRTPELQDQRWKPESGNECTADGDSALSRSVGLTLEGCAVGALIAKIGGSTADLKPDPAKLVLFSVGRHCVFTAPDATKAGSLYLAMNDTRDAVGRVQGRLEVRIFEAL